MARLAGRVAVVIGAGRGIGRAIAAGLGAEGAIVFVASRTPADVAAVADAIRAAGGTASACVADTASEDALRDLAERVDREAGRLDVLVNSAGLRMDHIGGARGGYPYRLPFTDLAVADWDRMVATNLRGPFLACRLLGPLLLAAGRGAVINVSAGAGVHGQAGRVPYSASKFGLEGLTQALAEEWRPLGVAVNAIEPGGSVLTDDRKRELLARDPSRAFLRPEVMVEPTLFLALQDATGLTGAHLNALAWNEERGLGGWEAWAAR